MAGGSTVGLHRPEDGGGAVGLGRDAPRCVHQVDGEAPPSLHSLREEPRHGSRAARARAIAAAREHRPAGGGLTHVGVVEPARTGEAIHIHSSRNAKREEAPAEARQLEVPVGEGSCGAPPTYRLYPPRDGDACPRPPDLAAGVGGRADGGEGGAEAASVEGGTEGRRREEDEDDDEDDDDETDDESDARESDGDDDGAGAEPIDCDPVAEDVQRFGPAGGAPIVYRIPDEVARSHPRRDRIPDEVARAAAQGSDAEGGVGARRADGTAAVQAGSRASAPPGAEGTAMPLRGGGCGGHAEVRPDVGAPLLRATCYICMTPAVWASPDVLRQRQLGFQYNLTTSHWPHEWIAIGGPAPHLPRNDPASISSTQGLLIGYGRGVDGR